MLDREFIIEQLEAKCDKVRVLAHDAEIICPFHDDSDPSCRVAISTIRVPLGTFSCWSCKASGNWNKLAAKLSMEGGEYHIAENPFGAAEQARFRHEQELKARSLEYSNGMPKASENWNRESWRGLPASFLIQLGAKRWYDYDTNCYRIVFPIMNKERKVLGSVGRRLDDEDFMRFRYSPGKWLRKSLLPLHMVKRQEVVVLVEGVFDALRLVYQGVPALSILGASNWTLSKGNTLEFEGFKKIVILMDGDKAGVQCAERITEDIEKNFTGRLEAIPLSLPLKEPKIDPGNMDDELLQKLRKRVLKLGGSLGHCQPMLG